ncbi:hypothetical protein KW797_01500 [Candidatus Parcubacteria bacterium]|nr:hypothetical protein [Candidatus Parcubacteria bacterium]
MFIHIDVADEKGIKTWGESRDAFLKEYLKCALQVTEGRVGKAAALAGYNRTVFSRLCKKFGIKTATYRTPSLR